jgi:hypothetical protein
MKDIIFDENSREIIEKEIAKAWHNLRHYNLSYEEGVACALEWIIGDRNDSPMSELPTIIKK